MMNIPGIPETLKRYPHWSVWRKDEVRGKIPYNPETKKGSKCNDKSTFRDFNSAKRRYGVGTYYAGMGVGLFDGLCAIDIDKCRDDNGELTEVAQDIVSIMNSYTEYSPSRKGLHIYFYVKNFVFDEKKYYINYRPLGLEVYVGRNRFMTVTGYKMPSCDYPIEVRDREVEIVLEKYMLRSQKAAKPPKEKPTIPPVTLSDDEIIAKASNAKNGEEFTRLWRGDTAGFNSHSEADLKLCSTLAFWCSGNQAQVDRLFRKSGLMRPKWDELRGAMSYGQSTLKKAVQGCKNFFGQTPKKKVQNAKLISPFSNENRYTPDDKGNSNLFSDSFKDELRFCPEAKEWYHYNGVRWKPGGNEAARERAKEVADHLWEFSAKIKDEDKRKRYQGNAQYLRNYSKRKDMLSDAQSVYPLRLSELDTKHELFNCRNGTLNLKERKVLPHNSAHMLSKVAGADFVQGAECERFERFIDEIMSGDREAARYLQKLFGYCLTGSPAEEKLFILYGSTTRNGKSTLLNSIAEVLGDYSRSVLPESLAEPKFLDSSKPSPDLARLAGIRLAKVNELPSGLLLNGAKVKSFTGGDTVTARFLNRDFFDYEPQFVLIINTNYPPDISDPTLFTSGRIVIIPFNRHFEEHEQDKKLKDELQTPEAKSGILNWMLEGLKLYREEGLEPPKSIKAEIAKYQHNSDKLALYIDDCIQAASTKGAYALMSSVYESYRRWCGENGFRPESIRKFKPALEAKGMTIKRRSEGVCVLDILVHDTTSFV